MPLNVDYINGFLGCLEAINDATNWVNSFHLSRVTIRNSLEESLISHVDEVASQGSNPDAETASPTRTAVIQRGVGVKALMGAMKAMCFEQMHSPTLRGPSGLEVIEYLLDEIEHQSPGSSYVVHQVSVEPSWTYIFERRWFALDFGSDIYLLTMQIDD